MAKTAQIIALLVLLFPLVSVPVFARPAPAPTASLSAGELSAPLVAPAAPAGEQPVVPVTPEAPQPLVIDHNHLMTYGGGLLYWFWMNDTNSDLKRGPENGGGYAVLLDGAMFSGEARRMSADEDGLYYTNQFSSTVVARRTYAPVTPLTLATYTAGYEPWLAVDEEYVYYDDLIGIFRASKTGTGAVRTSDATGVTGLAVDDTYIYWCDATGLWRSDKTCNNSGCWSAKEQLTAWPNCSYLAWEKDTPGRLFFVRSDATYWHISYKDVEQAGQFTIYSALKTTVAGVGQLGTTSEYVFWIEESGPDKLLRRHAMTGGADDTLYIDPLLYLNGLFVSPQGVIFHSSDAIYRLDFDAPPLSVDLGLAGWEITQAIQSLDNDDVPLVADRATFVRLYGDMITGTSPGNVEVRLHGYRGGNEVLPPLVPEDGPQRVGQSFDRAKASHGWLFRLPPHWIAAGTLVLSAEIDPRGIYSDPNPYNDTLAGNFNFEMSRPACLIMTKVKTPAGVVDSSYPNVGSMVSLAKRMWPVRDIWTYNFDGLAEEEEACLCWLFGFIPAPCLCYGPYELPEDEDLILSKLGWYDTWYYDPEACNDAGARSLYTGMIHPDTSTGDLLGAAYRNEDQMWVKFSPAGSRGWYMSNSPESGVTLAHEAAHCYGRKHVDCGGPDNTDPNYPYDPATLDDGPLDDPSTHFGFDPLFLWPLHPTYTADLMTYCGPAWPSDYTWRNLFNSIALARQPGENDVAGSRAAPVLAQSEAVGWVSGIITPSLGQGTLQYAWTLPTGTLGLGLLEKWQSMAAPDTPLVGTDQTSYHLRLRGAAGGILDDRYFTLSVPFGTPDAMRASFALTFPVPPTDVARLELMADSSVLDTLHPGDNVPTVEVLQPAGGEVVDDEVTVVWQAGDADGLDYLHYIVQYSPNQGQSWFALLTNWGTRPDAATVTLTLGMAGVPGSTSGGLLRVVASDGYHTGVGNSGLFTVPNRAPSIYIASPQPDLWVRPGESAVLSGLATDPEDGGLSGAALEWDIVGVNVATITGTDAALNRLPPGSYEVTFTAEDSVGQTAEATTTLTIAPLEIPRYIAESPVLDGFCVDGVYSAGVSLPLDPYDTGGQASVQLLRDNTYLWACFTGMNEGLTTTLSSIGVMVDVDNSRDPLAQPDDYGFVVYEDGTPTTLAGLGNGNFTTGPGGLAARVSRNGATWNAELRITAGTIGGWNHLVGMQFYHDWLVVGGCRCSWPYGGIMQRPDTWARTGLGPVPVIDTINPAEALVGTTPLTLTVLGSGFTSNCEVLWNGQPRVTVRPNEGQAVAFLQAGDYATAGVVEVQVDNNMPNMGEAGFSNPAYFTVWNVTPTITLLSPISTTSGSPDLDLTVHGSGFVSGATVMWNGEARPTTFVGSMQLVATIPAADLAVPRTASVSVVNPEPTRPSSSGATFTIVPAFTPYIARVFLPLVRR